jgi:hypothetical protein
MILGGFSTGEFVMSESKTRDKLEPTRADWPLLALNAAEDGTLSPVQMQKVLFLLERQAPELIKSDFYSFAAYNYGPFSQQIYADLKRHAREGRVAFATAPGRGSSNYVITASGEEFVGKFALAPELRAYLHKLMRWAKSLRFSELVGAIYQAYPDYAENSIFSSDDFVGRSGAMMARYSWPTSKLVTGQRMP